MIVIVDYRTGNCESIVRMLRKMGKDCLLSCRIDDINRAKILILPGIGSFDKAMSAMSQSGILETLNRRVLVDKIPVLGICLGMQLMTNKSEEGTLAGLGWFDAETIKFRFPSGVEGFKVPHIGWNRVRTLKQHPVTQSMDSDALFYFLHSYRVCCSRLEDVAAMTSYGIDFVSVVQKENIMGVQFHPEKSSLQGLALLQCFVEGSI